LCYVLVLGLPGAPSALAHFSPSHSDAGVGEGLPLRTVSQKPVRAEVMAPFGMSREEAIEELILNGGI
jgi:hypothetical protein